MRRSLILAIAVSTAAMLPAYALSAAPVKVGQTSAGPVLTDNNGMTLYTYTRDMPGHSNCNEACATAWPPLMATATDKPSGEWTVVTRDDGKMQWAHKDAALYLFANDKKSGDTTGDAQGKGKWHIAKP